MYTEPIELFTSEIARFSCLPWGDLTFRQRKGVASEILRSRGGKKNKQIAMYIESNSIPVTAFKISRDA